MTPEAVRKLLKQVQRGEVTLEQGVELLSRLDIEDLGFARIDHQRSLRCGRAEVVFGERKSPSQVLEIVDHLLKHGEPVLVTRIDPAVGQTLAARHPAGCHDSVSRTFSHRGAGPPTPEIPGLLIVSAGTADLPVAEEAAVTAAVLGLGVDRLYDVGIAGLERLLRQQGSLRRARVIIVVAGMEGALASVVAGLVKSPVIGVPTSVGYGTALAGITPLFAMLSSCSSGLTVVNVDNGFGAACAAHAILCQVGSRPAPQDPQAV